MRENAGAGTSVGVVATVGVLGVTTNGSAVMDVIGALPR